MITEFDKTDIFEEKCRPILTTLVQECRLARIPFFWSVCLKNSEDGSEYANDGIMCGSNNICLKDDQISKHMLVAAGLDVKLNEDPIEIMFDSFKLEDGVKGEQID